MEKRPKERSSLRKTADERRDEVLKRLLNTPPKPKKGKPGVSESILPPSKKGAPRKPTKASKQDQ